MTTVPNDTALADHGPVFPASPFPGQFWTLTATVDANDPGAYVYDANTSTWTEFVDWIDAST
jgi:hypothetical protein